jgi:hypothetical protein
MPSASDTAYPRLKLNPSTKELNELYSPTVYELAFARERARQPMQRAGLLLLLKTFQRLGYFVGCAEIPIPIVRHVPVSAKSDVGVPHPLWRLRRHRLLSRG